MYRSVQAVQSQDMAEMNMTEARATLPDVLDRVAAGEEITITRHGRRAAVVIRPEALRTRRAEKSFAAADEIAASLAAARAGDGPQVAGQGLTPERADELVAEIRQGRRSR